MLAPLCSTDKENTYREGGLDSQRPNSCALHELILMQKCMYPCFVSYTLSERKILSYVSVDTKFGLITVFIGRL
jgi:hypothetical protein